MLLRTNAWSNVSGRADLVFGVVLMLAAAIGCSNNGMVEIAGDVTFDGAPVAQGTISFFPADSQGATAETIIKEGRYSAKMPKGEKRVVIRGYKKVGQQFPWGKDNPPADILKEIVPTEFNDDSHLLITAEIDQNDANFELISSK